MTSLQNISHLLDKKVSEPQLHVKTRKRILLIEDDIDQNLLLAQKLCRSGFDVDSAYDGDRGLEKGLAREPDLILLDLGLPKLEGKWVLWRLKASERTANIPVVVVTGETDQQILSQIRDLGVVEIIRKPTAPQRVQQIVNDVLRTPLCGEEVSTVESLPIGGGEITYPSRIYPLALLFAILFAPATSDISGVTLQQGTQEMIKGDFPNPRHGVYFANHLQPQQAQDGIWRGQEDVKVE